MSDPHAPSEPSGPEDWAADLAAAEAWGDGLDCPFDDVPDFDPATSPEVDVSAGLATDRALIRTPTRRLFRDYRANPDAYKHLADLPPAGATLHGIIGGRYALWDLVPALIERTGRKVTDLHIATLSYSKANAAELLDLIDGGHVGRVGLVVSYYFKVQNQPLYDSLVPGLLSRGHRVTAMRTHCKIILARLSDRSCWVVESSANLRSCKNVEQFALTRCPQLYRFHAGWLDELLDRTSEVGGNAIDPGQSQQGPPAAARRVGRRSVA